MRLPAALASAVVATVAVAVAVVGISPAAADHLDRSRDPEFSVPVEDMAASFDCNLDGDAGDEHDVVLLVHGTFTEGHEQFDWNYGLLLPARGFDYCIGTYPERGTIDMQISAEYVAYAVGAIHDMTGRNVDLVGHSQGAMMPRWAVKFWPSVRAVLDDYVALAGPHHGTTIAATPNPFGQQPGYSWQFQPGSNFVRILNEDDETPGAVDYTSIYTATDELVQPTVPEPTAALDWGLANTRVANILTQDLCPARAVDHLSIGTTDAFVHELVIDALTHDGPTDPGRVDTLLCNIPDQYVVPESFAAIFAQGFPDFPEFTTTDAEPPTRPYARARPAAAGDDEGAGAPDAGDPGGQGTGRADQPSELPATGGAPPIGPGAVLASALAAVGLRRGQAAMRSNANRGAARTR